jgi:hypothetical protein
MILYSPIRAVNPNQRIMIGEKEKLTLLVPNLWNKNSNNNIATESHTTSSATVIYVLSRNLTSNSTVEFHIHVL